MVSVFEQLEKKLKMSMIALVNKTAATVVDQTIQSMRARKSGMQHKSLANRSSAIGETPAYQSGDLARSITKELDITPFAVTATITVGSEYAPILVRRGRPILSPAAKLNKIPFLMNAKRLIQQLGKGRVGYGNF